MSKTTVYSLKETAEVLGVSMPLVYQLARRDDFPAIRISARRIVVPSASLEAWLEKQAEHHEG